MSYDYRTEQFPPTLDFRALSDIVQDAKQGNLANALKPFYHVEGWLFSVFGGDKPGPSPSPDNAPVVHVENPSVMERTFNEGYVHAYPSFSEAELIAKADSHSDKPVVGGLTEIVLAYRVIKTLALYAPEFYAVVKAVLSKLTKP